MGYELAESDIYYPLRKERNEKARLEFLSNKTGKYDVNAVYLSDLLRGGVTNDDSRLR